MSTEPKYLVKSGQVFTRFDRNGIVGYRPEEATIPVVEKLPLCRWQGGKIPIALWRQILAFFKWSYDTTKSETQVRLFYNFTTKEWRAHAFPQKRGTGMTAEEIEDHPNRAEDMRLFAGFEPWGTVHHHCSCGAFQSGTDRSDEESQAGLHVTVGHMDKPQHDLHSRVTMVLPGELDGKGELVRKATKLFIEPDLLEWFELSERMKEVVPPDLHSIILKHRIIAAATADEEFPSRWKDNVIEIQRPPPAPIVNLGVTQPIRGLTTGHNGAGSAPSQAELRLRLRHGRGNRNAFTDEQLRAAWSHYFAKGQIAG